MVHRDNAWASEDKNPFDYMTVENVVVASVDSLGRRNFDHDIRYTDKDDTAFVH